MSLGAPRTQAPERQDSVFQNQLGNKLMLYGRYWEPKLPTIYIDLRKFMSILLEFRSVYVNLRHLASSKSQKHQVSKVHTRLRHARSPPKVVKIMKKERSSLFQEAFPYMVIFT